MKRVLLVEELAQVAEHLRGLLARDGDVQIIGVEADPDVAAARAATERPEVLFIDALLPVKGKTDAFSLAKRVRASSPSTRIVMITVPQRPLTPRHEDAIDAVFVLPGGANEMGVALGPRTKETRGKGRVIVIYSPKGGTGKTTIAVNLACALRRGGSTVALMDGVMQFGALRHVLPVPTGTRSIVDLPPGHAMAAVLEEVLWEGPAGVRVLLAPERPEQADLLQPAEIGNAIVLLAASHDFVIVDAPTRLADDTLTIFDAATTILIVSTYMDVTVQNARAAVNTFGALGYGGQKPLRVVVNQGNNLPGMNRADLERVLELSVIAEISSDWKTVSDSLNLRQPYVLTAPAAAVTLAIVGLAAELQRAQQ